MPPRQSVAPARGRRATGSGSPRAIRLWYIATALGGLAFGLFGDRRPLGTDLFAHPLFLFAAAIAVGLLILRVALRRPVPEVLPERTLMFGCAIGLVLFLAGNFVTAHVARLAGLAP